MDFIVDLPESEGYINLIVFTDRLRKGVILEPYISIKVEDLAKVFIRRYYRYYKLPIAIVSNRGL